MEGIMKNKVMEWCVDAGLSPEKKIVKEQEFHFLLTEKNTGSNVDVLQNIGSDELFVGAGIGFNDCYLNLLKDPNLELRNDKFIMKLKIALLKLDVRWTVDLSQGGIFIQQLLYREDLTKTDFMKAVNKAIDCRVLVNLLLAQEYGNPPPKDVSP